MSTPEIVELQEQIATLNTQITAVTTAADESWMLLTGVLVFFMQTGFAMLEAGSVRAKNATNILFKNILDAIISAFFFWLLGFGFAYGKDVGGFIGNSLFALDDPSYTNYSPKGDLQYHNFFFQWVFAATSATIVSGSVAERCKLESYFIYSALISTFIYPIIVHWCWSDGGWLSPFNADPNKFIFNGAKSNNFIDFAGSGIVHLVGGISGLMGAIVLGPRRGRFNEDGTVNDIPGHNMSLVALGVLLLWMGWYGFNAGSTLCIVNCSKLASHICVTTTLGAAGACWMAIIYQTLMKQHYNMSLVGNSVLAGCVSVTAGCATMAPWGAWITGMIGALVYIGASKLLLRFRIDDPVDASALHGGCGLWGVLAAGIFSTDELAAFAGYVGSGSGFHPIKDGEQFGVQIVGALAIATWTVGTAGSMFYAMKYFNFLRVSPEVEDAGLDMPEHSVNAYEFTDVKIDTKSASKAYIAVTEA